MSYEVWAAIVGYGLTVMMCAAAFTIVYRAGHAKGMREMRNDMYEHEEGGPSYPGGHGSDGGPYGGPYGER